MKYVSVLFAVFVSSVALRAETLVVANPSAFARVETVEVPFKGAYPKGFPSQVYGTNLLVSVRLAANETKEIVLDQAKPDAKYARHLCTGRAFPEHMDDFAWENDVLSMRVYGETTSLPAPIGKGLVSSGIEPMFKKSRMPVLENWFAKGAKPAAGEGPDVYVVGEGRGCGGIGRHMGDDKWQYARNWAKAEVVTTGPVRAVFDVTWLDWGGFVAETRRITIDRGCPFTHFDVRLRATRKFAYGLALGPGLDASSKRGHGGDPVEDKDLGYVAHWCGTSVEGLSVGTAVLLDPVMPFEYFKTDSFGCAYVVPRLPGYRFQYWAGAGWSAGGYKNAAEWKTCVKRFAEGLRNPMTVTVK